MSQTTVMLGLVGLVVAAFIFVGVRAILRSQTDLLGDSVDEDRARELIRDAVEWAEDQFPLPEEDYPNVPQSSPARWYLYASAAAIQVAVLTLILRKGERQGRAFAEHVDSLLEQSHPEARQAFRICMSQSSQYMKQKNDADFPFFLGMWVWKHVINEEPTEHQAEAVNKIGALVYFAFSKWWQAGVREVAIGDDGSALVWGGDQA